MRTITWILWWENTPAVRFSSYEQAVEFRNDVVDGLVKNRSGQSRDKLKDFYDVNLLIFPSVVSCGIISNTL